MLKVVQICLEVYRDLHFDLPAQYLHALPVALTMLTLDNLQFRAAPSSMAHDPTLEDFLVEDDGQDLIEYSLLMAFVALAPPRFSMKAGKSITGIWSTSNSQLVQANLNAS